MSNAHKPEQRGRCAESLEARTNRSTVVCTKSALIARYCDISRTPLGLMFAHALQRNPDTGDEIAQWCAQCAAAAKQVPSRSFGIGLWHGTVDFL